MSDARLIGVFLAMAPYLAVAGGARREMRLDQYFPMQADAVRHFGPYVPLRHTGPPAPTTPSADRLVNDA